VRTRVIIVDNDDISRRGLGELLADHPAIDVGAVLSHDAALAWDGSWQKVDVVIVDATDEGRGDDGPAGVAVVKHVRRRAGPHTPVIIAITGQFFDDAVRRRMREADADFIYHRSEVQDTDSLYAAVLSLDGARTPGVDQSVGDEEHMR
jgi:DNA-binding NarL/FixJ family response regulator